MYESYGAEEYYRQHGENYENPHQRQVTQLILRNFPNWDCSGGVLDFCAGGGEVTLALRQCGAFPISGSDPFTYELYEKNTGLPCARLSFDDVIRGAQIEPCSVVICSFAMHLCPEKDLFPLIWQLFSAAPLLVIITPHKRPELEKIPGVELVGEDFELTERGKKVRLKMYSLTVLSNVGSINRSDPSCNPYTSPRP